KHFPQNGPNDRSVEVEAFLAALYGGSVQYYTSTPVKKNEKIVLQQHSYDRLAGAFNLMKGKQGDKAIRLTQSQAGRANKFVEAARKRLLELGIRIDQIIPKTYGKTIGWILSRDPAYQNPFLHTFLGVASELTGVTSAQSRLERAVDVGGFSAEDEAYLRRYDDVFQPHILSSGGRQPYVNRIKHNNARGPYKGGERFIFSDSLKADDLFMERFNDLVGKEFNLQELRYFLRKWVREETLPLAFGMTTKAAVAHLPYGGGKGSVLFADIFEEKNGAKTIQDLFTGEAADVQKTALIRHQARVLFKAGKIGPKTDIPAPDVGSNALHMDQMTDELLLTIYEEAKKDGSFGKWPESLVKKIETIQKEKLSPLTTPYLKAVTEELEEFRKKKTKQGIPLPQALKMLAETRATFTSKSTQFGGSIFRGPATGYGGILVLEKALGSLQEKTVKLMGFGNVGQWAAKRLIEKGAVIKLISQGPYGIVYKKNGFSAEDLGTLERLNSRHRSFHLLTKDPEFKIEGATLVGEEEFLDYPMDIHILAAKENSIHKGNVEKVADSIYLELANGGITNEAYDVLLQSGALIIPDSIANAGGVTVSYFEWLQNLQGEKWTEKQVIEELERMLVEGVERADQVRTEFETDWRTAADILMIREVLEARDKAKKSRRSEARLAGEAEKPLEIKTEAQRHEA
ncbi:MAG TPA: Glu/Leu/Phe/Val dehydrogenase dimerization domain-containing protein, partial [bacterium]|nr:Glu/Leu/Phe/Val dehydrogenase dimerization domain-containing protein [bacterium]